MKINIARNNSGTYSYEYNLKDHLGNTRLTFYKNPSTGSADILQQDNYLPFGMAVSITGGTNKYLYNGKELQPETGVYDYADLIKKLRFMNLNRITDELVEGLRDRTPIIDIDALTHK